MFFTLLISGLVLGSIYGLIALGYSMIFKSSGLLSFVQGDILTLGAFLGLTFYSYLKLPFVLSLFLTVICAMALGFALEKGVIRPLLNKNVMTVYIVLATIAVSYIIQNGSMVAWGSITLNFPAIFSKSTIKIGKISVQPEALMCIAVGLLCMILLHLYMTKTKLGTSMRAASMDAMAAESCGIDVSLSTGLSWGISAGLAAIAGILIGPIYGVYTTLGATIGRKGFSSAIIGGYGNMYGAIVGGLLLGLLETFSASLISSTYKNLIAYCLLLLFLLLKPTGIFNERAVND
ncbi:MAG: branched-chain amino acid ABC transporter permease [Lachnospiraceae bacterium]|jgi:branched-chain amino acid transport system permease protein|uniref:branched-chain amino acid ABC transporter permease n=1 Tax=Candidatus Merdisoma sp. JLR.KK006 TaxID=3112626 RepID=UPI002FF1D413|nr:branched-chain amino acid ABC transporter permease [Lachnospiraceae bacterium]